LTALYAFAVPARYGIEMKEFSIPLPDGVHLAADIYMPSGGANGERFPVLLEYLPYRKTESRSRNYSLYSYFVQRGYIVAGVDIRGTGNSEGRLIPYEYSNIEQQDGEVVIDWLSKQSWSTDKIGMFGISWVRTIIAHAWRFAAGIFRMTSSPRGPASTRANGSRKCASLRSVSIAR
jgi:predicted acyl esterase